MSASPDSNAGVPLKILQLEDNPADAELIIREVRNAGYDPDFLRVETKEQFVAQFSPDWDLILVDYRLPEFTGLEALKIIQDSGSDTPVIVVTGTLGDELAAQCILLGASDYLLKDRLGRLGQAIAIALERKQLEKDSRRTIELLRESEERYRTLFQESQDAIFVRGTDGRVVDFNQAALDLFGYDREEWMTLNVSALYVNDDARVKFEQEIVASGSVKDYEQQLRRKDGEIITCLVTSSLRHDQTGSVIGYQGMVRDITKLRTAELDRGRLEEDLKQRNQQLEQRVNELEALNKLFQEHLAQRSALAKSYQHLVGELQELSERLKVAAEEALEQPVPDIEEFGSTGSSG